MARWLLLKPIDASGGFTVENAIVIEDGLHVVNASDENSGIPAEAGPGWSVSAQNVWAGPETKKEDNGDVG